MEKKRTTLADIAKKAGVHVTTVSLAMRNHPRLPETTRLRLRKLAEEMGYRPDPWMRALVAYRNRVVPHQSAPTIAYVTNWNTRFGWRDVTAHPDFYAGAEAKAKELGFGFEHFWLREPNMTHGRLSRVLTARGIGGVIVASHVREHDEPLSFEWEHFSAVKIEYLPRQPHISTVTHDHLQMIRLAMRRVMEAGYKRIALVMDEGWDLTVRRLWTIGFFGEQQSVAIEERLEPYLFPNKEKLDVWLKRNRPEVVIGRWEWLEPVLKTLKWSVPKDIAFVDLFLEAPTTQRAGIVQNHRAVGGIAVEVLSSQIQLNQRGVPAIPTTTCVRGEWNDGATLPPRSH